MIGKILSSVLVGGIGVFDIGLYMANIDGNEAWVF